MALSTNTPIYQEIRRMFLDEGKTRREIFEALDNRLSLPTVRSYVTLVIREAREKGLDIPKSCYGNRGSRSFAEQDPISQVHIRVGARLAFFRSQVNLGPQKFADHYHWGNKISLRRMELGQYDFTLTELSRIAKILGTDLSNLLEARTVNITPPKTDAA